MFESAIVFLSLIFTYDLFAQSAESAVNELKVLSQQNNCDPTSRCIIVGENSILVGTSSVDGNIHQILQEENKCVDNSTCAHFGEEPFIPGNKVALGVSSSGGSSTASDLSIDSEQKLNHVNECTNMRGTIILSEFGTLIFGCVTGNRNLIQIGESVSTGSISNVANVSTDTQQIIDVSQECTNGSELGDCPAGGTNDIIMGTSGFGGSSHIDTADLESKQNIDVQKNCDSLAVLEIFCSTQPNNLVSVGRASFGGTSNANNVKLVSDQEITEVVNCHLLLGFCAILANNDIVLDSVSNVNVEINQKSDQEMDCNDKNHTNCDASANNVLSIGGLGLPGVISTVSNLDLNLDEKWQQEIKCADAITFGICSSGGINLVEIGGPPNFGEGTVTVDNLKAELSQTVDQNAECGETSVFFCGNVLANRIILGESSGGFFDLFDNSTISNIDIVVAQSTFQENKCSGGEGVSCSNGINENEVNIAGDSTATTARSSTVSDLHAHMEQNILASNECKNDTGCSNDGDNTVDIARTSDIFRCCAVEANTVMNVQDVNSDIEQTLFQSNDCSDNLPATQPTESGDACVNNMRNLVSIGSTMTSFGFIDPFAAHIDVSDIDANIVQIAEQNNNCHDNTNCFGNNARNRVEIGTFSALDFTADETEVTVTLSEIIADGKQEVKQESTCNDAPLFQSCGNIGDNRILIGSPSAFGSSVNISKISLGTDQSLLQENTCKDNIICRNNAGNRISVGSGGSTGSPGLETLSNIQQDSDQEILQTNKCEDGDGVTECKSNGQNIFNTYGNSESNRGPDATPISVFSTQSVYQANRCEDGSECNKEALNSANITQAGASSVSTDLDEGKEGSTNRVTLHQLSEQNDNCSLGSTCVDSSSNSVTFDLGGYEGDGKIEQQIDQGNHCLIGSTCGNDGSTSATIDDSAPADQIQVKQSIDQQNLCIRDSACSNTGLVTDGSGSNIQTNTCVGDSTCNNSGKNNKTVCVRSADCENTGTDTNVISKGQNCSSGDPGSTTVCANGRTITITH